MLCFYYGCQCPPIPLLSELSLACAYLRLFVLLSSKRLLFFLCSTLLSKSVDTEQNSTAGSRYQESNAGPFGLEASVITSCSSLSSHSSSQWLLAHLSKIDLLFIQLTKQRVSASGTSANLGRKFSNMEFVLWRKFAAPCRLSLARTGLEFWLSVAASRPFSTPSSRR